MDTNQVILSEDATTITVAREGGRPAYVVHADRIIYGGELVREYFNLACLQGVSADALSQFMAVFNEACIILRGQGAAQWLVPVEGEY